MKNILIVGMGRFGRHLAIKMNELGNDVMIVDKDESIINSLAPMFTNAFVGDCTNETALKSLGVNNFDICFVSIGDNFQSSLEATSLLKELGAKYVVSKASRDIQAKFLLRNGADEVVYPERDMAEKTAIKHNAKNIFDYLELSDDLGIFEIPVISNWIEKSIISIDIRNLYNLNIIAIRKCDGQTVLPTADYVFHNNDHLVVIGKQQDVFKLANKS